MGNDKMLHNIQCSSQWHRGIKLEIIQILCHGKIDREMDNNSFLHEDKAKCKFPELKKITVTSIKLLSTYECTFLGSAAQNH